MKHEIVHLNDNIQNRIYNVRGLQIMLDEDLAELYGIQTKVLNQTVKRNIERFPHNYMFQVSLQELKSLRSQIVTTKTSRGGRQYLPYVFTEQGVAMLAGVLRSDIAIKMSIRIIDAFVSMRKFLLSNAQIFQRLDHVEKKQLEHENKIEKIFDAIESKDIKPEKGIFYDGQIFDAYKFISDIIRSAKKSIILIDNFINDSVLTLFTKRNKDVVVTIYTQEISRQLALDLAKYNNQYSQIEIKEFKKSHDRFLIIDETEIYHIGASLKDLGKRWFAFSKFDKEVFELKSKLDKLS